MRQQSPAPADTSGSSRRPLHRGLHGHGIEELQQLQQEHRSPLLRRSSRVGFGRYGTCKTDAATQRSSPPHSLRGRRQEALPEQILLLAFGRQAADEMNTRIKERLHTDGIKAKTFHALALQIIQEGSKKAPKISKLETDAKARRSLLIKTWQQQCAEKKVQASS